MSMKFRKIIVNQKIMPVVTRVTSYQNDKQWEYLWQPDKLF